jgi:hypothetical protein
MIHKVIKACLEAIAEKSIGPTFTTRNLFLISSILYNARTYFDSTFVTFDNYPKSSQNIGKENALFIYTYHAEIALLLLNSSIFSNSQSLVNFLENNSLFKNSKYIQFKQLQNYKNLRSVMISNLNTYLSYRANDNSAVANVQLSDTELPNNNKRINPNGLIDFENYTEPLKWTPINTNFYLTPHWGDVNGFLPESKLDSYTSFIERFLDGIDFQNEVQKVYQTSLTLTDKEKCIAEFWAGAKNTITPPGFWNVFLIAYFEKYGSSMSDDIEARNFLILNTALLQTSIFVWKTKFNHMQARPIQTIRYYYPNDTITYYGGTEVSSSLWKPYQPSTFITPPFPDFISGHSTFSAVGSRVLSKLIGNNLLNLNLSIDGTFMKNLSPLFSNQNNSEDRIYLHCINIFPKCSEIDENVPNKLITLTYNSWDDMALEAGVSRIYGGIHYDSSNYTGYLVGNKISEDICSLFSLS